MLIVGSFEAKTRLASLLDQVAAGEHVTITKHGTPVARLIPVADSAVERARDAIAQLKMFHKGQTLGSLKAKDLISEGRR